MIIDRYIHNEIYVVAGSEDDDNTDIYITADWGDLMGHLGEMNPDTEEGVRVFHGILTTAEFLPSSFRGKSIFVICFDHNDPVKGYCVESGADTPDALADELTSLLNFGDSIIPTTCDIDDFYILYGYQITTCISVREDVIDEEIIDTCKKISAETEAVGETAEANFKQQEGV